MKTPTQFLLAWNGLRVAAETASSEGDYSLFGTLMGADEVGVAIERTNQVVMIIPWAFLQSLQLAGEDPDA